MSNWVGIHQGEQGVRLIWAEVTDAGFVIRRVATIDGSVATSDNAVEQTPREQTSGAWMAAAVERLKSWRVPKPQVVVTIDRVACELRTLEIPPVPEEEVPNIVRFQALQQFNTVSDEAALDYVSIPSGDRPRVLAAAVTAVRMAEIRRHLDRSNLELRSVVFAPCGLAVMAERSQQSPRNSEQVSSESAETTIIVGTEAHAANIVVARGKQLLMSRSLPRRSAQIEGSPDAVDSLVTGLRRTVAATRSQFADSHLMHIVIFGEQRFQLRLAEACQSTLGLPATCIDPLEACQWHAEFQPAGGESLVPYAALVGAVWERAIDGKWLLDFLHPRRTPVPKDMRGTWTAIATVALAAGLLAAGLWWWALADRDSQIQSLRREIADLDKLIEVVQKQQGELEQLDSWYQKSPNWLLELHRLSQRLPPADQLRLERLQADLASDGRGRLIIKGMVDEAGTITTVESRLRDDSHRVEGMDRDFVGSDAKYPWLFAESILIDGPTPMPMTQAEGTNEAARPTVDGEAVPPPSGTERSL